MRIGKKKDKKIAKKCLDAAFDEISEAVKEKVKPILDAIAEIKEAIDLVNDTKEELEEAKEVLNEAKKHSWKEVAAGRDEVDYEEEADEVKEIKTRLRAAQNLLRTLRKEARKNYPEYYDRF